MKNKETKHLTCFRTSKLKPGEQIACHLEGWIGEIMGQGKDRQHNGQLILTNKRLCFYRKGFFGEVLETMPLEKIGSVEILSHMGYRVLTCHSSHDELAFKTVESADLFDDLCEKLDELRSSGQNTKSSTSISVADELMKLAEMKSSGILTDDEFETLKGKLLAT